MKITRFILLFVVGFCSFAQAAKIKIDIDRTIGEVDPKIYGVFMEPITFSPKRLGLEGNTPINTLYGPLYNPESALADENGFNKVYIEAAKRFKQKIHAVAVRSNHVHMVAEYVDVPIGVLVGYYKSAGRIALKGCGFKGKAWTGGYDKRFCFSEKELRARVDYVNKHVKK